MRIVVFGASGKTGSLLVEQALKAGHEVVAYVRRPGSVTSESPKLKVVVGRLSDTVALKNAITGADACLSTLGGGSLTKSNSEVLDGISTILGIMEAVAVPRFVYLSSIGTGESRYYMPQPIRFLIVNVMLRVPLADHTTNEKRIAASKLQWTVVRPGSLTDGPLTENLKHGSEKTKLTGNPGISRANVAAFMLAQLADTAYVNKYVWLHE
jgi:putative NADH-flavin reductase